MFKHSFNKKIILQLQIRDLKKKRKRMLKMKKKEKLQIKDLKKSKRLTLNNKKMQIKIMMQIRHLLKDLIMH